MHLEPNPIRKNGVLVTPETQEEVSILIDAIIPRSLFRYYRAMRQLQQGWQEPETMPTINLTRNQLRWIGKRVAPWEKHVLGSVSKPDNIATAHQMAIEIDSFLSKQ